MPFDVWFAFSISSAIMLMIPGPTLMLVISYALGRGKSTAWVTVPGVTLGDFTAMTVSMLGVGAVLAASATLFTVLKFIGAAYLIWLGYKLWHERIDYVSSKNSAETKTNASRLFIHAYVVTALNPKSIVFFVAFVPQFIDSQTDVFGQLVILESTFLILATLNALLWALAAGQMRHWFSSMSARKYINRSGGSLLIFAGLVTASLRNI